MNTARLRVTHETTYDYSPPVETSQHMAYLRPVDTPCQTLVTHQLQVDPAPARLTHARDGYGNWRSFFALQTPHSRLRVVSSSEVLTRAAPAGTSRVTWEAVQARYVYRAGGPWDAAAEFAFPSPHVPRHADFVEWSRASFLPGRPLIEVARELMHRIHRELRYESASTEIHTPAREALAQRRGVCQDFAHILIAGLRAHGLPARYVSGYLLTQPPPGQSRLIGSDASHAWASVYLPDLGEDGFPLGWHDLDPTNDRDGRCSPGADYVTVAIGRDFSDVSPLRGVIHGGAHHTLSVGVTVEPVTGDGPALTSTEPERLKEIP